MSATKPLDPAVQAVIDRWVGAIKSNGGEPFDREEVSRAFALHLKILKQPPRPVRWIDGLEAAFIDITMKINRSVSSTVKTGAAARAAAWAAARDAAWAAARAAARAAAWDAAWDAARDAARDAAWDAARDAAWAAARDAELRKAIDRALDTLGDEADS